MDSLDQLTRHIIGSAMRVHSVLGPGLLEKAYHLALAHELRKQGLSVRTEVPMTVVYDGVELDLSYRMDLVVERLVVVEVKALVKLLPVHRAQLLSQLRLAGLPAGLLINFHELHLRDGVQRLINRR